MTEDRVTQIEQACDTIAREVLASSPASSYVLVSYLNDLIFLSFPERKRDFKKMPAKFFGLIGDHVFYRAEGTPGVYRFGLIENVRGVVYGALNAAQVRYESFEVESQRDFEVATDVKAELHRNLSFVKSLADNLETMVAASQSEQTVTA